MFSGDMERVSVTAPSKTYPIYVGAGFGSLAAAFAEAGLSGERACVVADENAAGFYMPEVKAAAEAAGMEVSAITVPSGERHKTLETVKGLYEGFLTARLNRKSAVVALGGGVCGDMAGFAAATYMRGIRFVQIPTTLLSQVDSSVGGKTGVDLMGAKNIVGAFWQPEFVYISVNTLKTLPAGQFASGMAEAVKHGLICDADYFEWIFGSRRALTGLDGEALIRLVTGSCRIKAGVVMRDERESGVREILNFGHTFGHAVESLCGYGLPHGHCVSIGMAAALSLSVKLGNITENEAGMAVDLLAGLGLPAAVPPEYRGFTEDDVYDCMLSDKKAGNNEMNLVLLRRFGEAYLMKNAGEEFTKEGIKIIL